MSKKSAKEKKKAKARNACAMNVAKKAALHEQKKYAKLTLKPGNAPDAFRDVVLAAFSALDFTGGTQFPEWLQTATTIHASFGLAKALEYLRGVYRNFSELGIKLPIATFGQFWTLYYVGGVAEAIYARIPQDERKRYFPYCSFTIHPGNDGKSLFQIRLSALKSTYTPNGTAYYSPYSPTVTIDGRKRIVAFYAHAIERIGERKFDNRDTYLCLGDYHAVLKNCVHYEPSMLYGGQPAFTMFDLCFEKGFRAWNYATNILAYIDHRLHHYYRFGYFPVNLYGDFAVAKSLLPSGYGNTPEYSLVVTSSLPREQKTAMLAKLDNWTENTLMRSNDFSVLKYFHDSGIPQVKATAEEFFRYS